MYSVPKGCRGVRSASGRRCRKATAQNRRQPRPTGKPPRYRQSGLISFRKPQLRSSTGNLSNNLLLSLRRSIAAAGE